MLCDCIKKLQDYHAEQRISDKLEEIKVMVYQKLIEEAEQHLLDLIDRDDQNEEDRDVYLEIKNALREVVLLQLIPLEKQFQ